MGRTEGMVVKQKDKVVPLTNHVTIQLFSYNVIKFLLNVQ
jgi:hypothetical protein